MKALPYVLAAIALAMPPMVLGTFYVNFLSQVLIASVAALGLNLMIGYGGMTSLGHGAFVGIAAYLIAGITTRSSAGHLFADIAALVAVAVTAASFGVVALRARGLGFLMITLAFNQVVWGVAYRWVGVTGGENGITGVTRPEPFGISLDAAAPFYYFVLCIAAVSFVAIRLFARSPFGASLRGVRDQPRRMAALGYDVWWIRWVTFVVSAFWCGVAGMLYIYFYEFISPHALAMVNSAEYVLMVIVGGPGTMAGPVLGALIILSLKILASSYIQHWVMLLGLIFIFVMMFLPDGIIPGLAALYGRGRTRWETCGAARWLRRARV